MHLVTRRTLHLHCRSVLLEQGSVSGKDDETCDGCGGEMDGWSKKCLAAGAVPEFEV
jgi:hypothetical protein